MIGVKLQGRLGNQLFQYAFAIATSKKLDTHYFINEDCAEDIVKKYFDLHELTSTKIQNKLLLSLFAYKAFDVVYQTSTDEVDAVLKKIDNRKFYEGYFQSTKYFEPYENLIKKNFTIKKRYKKAFKEKYGYLNDQKYIAIHCRLGDYLTWKHDALNLENSVMDEVYYSKALSLIEDSNQLPIVVVTDDPQNLGSVYPSLSKYQVVSDSEIVDFQVLLNASKIVVTNSSFSWWAAYLNTIPLKTVIAPLFWIGYKAKTEYPKGIKTSEFSWIEV